MTGQNIFDKAIDLCGLRSSMTDAPIDVSDLSERAIELINILLAENSVLDCKIRKAEHEVLKIESLTQDLPCSEIVAALVLPYGLARLFMLGEDDDLAAGMERLYTASKATALSFGKAKHKAITEVYS